VFVIGVDTIKDSLRAAFAVKDASLPRHIAFAAELGEDYFEQLCAERRVIKRNTRGGAERIWKRVSGVRNEALDCLVYATAALEGLKQSGLKLQAAIRKADDVPSVGAPAALTAQRFADAPPPRAPSTGAVSLAGWARGR
jgi:phage terminase large subunit GpA-like protein